MNKAEIDEVFAAAKCWVSIHYRAELTVREAQELREALVARTRDRFKAPPAVIELVQIAHCKATQIIDARRDRAQLAEHGRMAT